MGILDFFRNRQQKSENTSLIVKGDSAVRPHTPQKKKIRTIVDFVENALISNGGNYEDIYQKLLTISEFAKHAKEYGVECFLGSIDETLKDFFTDQQDIKHFPLKGKLYTAFYAKKEGRGFYNHRGVTVMQDEQTMKPIMYYGRRHQKAELHTNDCIFAFGDDKVIFRDESDTSYGEIPLWGVGTYAEFSFDESNHLTTIKYRYKTNPRLGFWSKEQICEFDAESGQYRLQPTQIPERTYNDPKPSDKSIKNCANFIVNMFEEKSSEN